ncbi:MAG TPA: hypothetical protein VLC09_18720 [Polyangiaceae bacterium]|nr:hypothetical protein [Polyangiaceae bacterium]
MKHVLTAALLAMLPLACSSSSTDAGDGGLGGASTGGASGVGGTSGSGGVAATGGGDATGGGSSADYPALEECPTASLDRLQKWWGTAEGPTIPGADQSLLVSAGAGYEARVEFASAPNWHVAPVWIANEYAGVDVSASTELRIVYSATSDLWVQLRPESTYSGGDKWHHLLPSTGGSDSEIVIPLDAASWTEKFGTPPATVEQTLTELLALVFVGNTNNVFVVKSLRIRGYEPPCL